MRRALRIAQHEYVTNVRRTEFILLTIGLPAFGLIVVLLAALPVMLMARNVPETLTVGVVDEWGRCHFPEEIPGIRIPGRAGKIVAPVSAYHLREFADRQQAKAAMSAGSVSSYLVVPENYVSTGNVEFFTGDENVTLAAPQQFPPLRGILVEALLRQRVSPEILARVRNPIVVQRRGGSGAAYDPFKGLSRMVVPYAFTVIMMMSIFVASGYLLRGISDEKDGRIIEIMLSSASPTELFVGKLLGLSAVGLTQVLIWVFLGLAPVGARIPALQVSTRSLLLAPALYLLGFLLYGAIMSGIGALGTSWRESQQLSAMVSVFIVLPVMFFPLFMDAPNGALATWLSLIPLTSPMVMMIRVALTTVPWWQMLVCVVGLLLAIWLFVIASVKVFRTAMLMYGKRPGLAEVWRWLREPL